MFPSGSVFIRPSKTLKSTSLVPADDEETCGSRLESRSAVMPTVISPPYEGSPSGTGKPSVFPSGLVPPPQAVISDSMRSVSTHTMILFFMCLVLLSLSCKKIILRPSGLACFKKLMGVPAVRKSIKIAFYLIFIYKHPTTLSLLSQGELIIKKRCK